MRRASINNAPPDGQTFPYEGDSGGFDSYAGCQMTEQEIINECIDRLIYFFEDYDKAQKWLYIKNPYFGEISPIRLIKQGKGQEVIDLIDSAQDDWDL